MITRFEQFASSISGIYKQIQKIERDEMVKYGLRGSFAQYLLAIRRYEAGVTSVMLSNICDKDKAAISRVTAEMEEKGLIRRNYVVENRYRALLTLTEKGQEIADHIHERATLAVEAAGKGLQEEERQILHAALTRIAENLGAICEDGIPETK